MLKTLRLRSAIKLKKLDLEALRAKANEIMTRRHDLQRRAAETEAALEEVSAETSEQDRRLIEEQVEQIEAEETQLSEEEAQNTAAVTAAEGELAQMEEQLNQSVAHANQQPAGAAGSDKPAQPAAERKENHTMDIRKKKAGSVYRSVYTAQERAEHVARADVKGFLARMRALKGVTRAVSGEELLIPDYVLELLRDNMTQYGKLLKHVRTKVVHGTGRTNIVALPPEAVWMEVKGALNELEIGINQVETDGYMVGGVLFIHNTTLEDSDENLFAEAFDMLGQAMGRAADKAILFGTGEKMPVGIFTRLKTTAKPAWWGDHQGDFTDLSTTHIGKMSADNLTAEKFFQELILGLGSADDTYSAGDASLFWAMNSKTRKKIRAMALGYNASAAIVSQLDGTMPVIGGAIETIADVPDDMIIGGYGDMYQDVERSGAKIDSSEHVKWMQNYTGFRAVARRDGKPIRGEAFAAWSISTTAPSDASVKFAEDKANASAAAAE